MIITLEFGSVKKLDSCAADWVKPVNQGLTSNKKEITLEAIGRVEVHILTYLKDHVYETLRKKIIDCEYEPGSIISETMLLQNLGVSRTPVREALNRLAMENLVTIIPKKGVIVNGISINDIIQVFDARMIVEPQIIQLYGDRLDKKELAGYLERCKNAKSINEMICLDEEFHNMTYGVCSNRFLKEFCASLEVHNHRNRIWRSNEERVHVSLSEHVQIVEALLNNDYLLAGSLMHQHLMNAKEYAFKKYF